MIDAAFQPLKVSPPPRIAKLVFRLLLVILDVLFIILCMIECSGDLEASYSAVP